MLSQAMQVLRLFSTTRRELGVAEVAQILHRPKSTVSGWMSAMLRVGLLDREEAGGRYRLGIRLAALGEIARRSTSAQRVALPILARLARRTRETATLNALIGSNVVNMVAVESTQPVHSAAGLGIPMPIHATAAGKVLVAWRPAEEIRHMLPLRLEQFTPATISEIDTFFEQLAVVREEGYSQAVGELAMDLFAASAPIRDTTGRVVAAISITAPISRVPSEKMALLGEELVEAADTVSQALGYEAALAAD